MIENQKRIFLIQKLFVFEHYPTTQEINPLEIIYLGLYNGNSNRSMTEMLKETISLLEPQEKNPRVLEQLLSLIFVANGRLLSHQDAKEIMEVMKMKIDDNPAMTALQEIFEEEGMAKGLEKGLERGLEKAQTEMAIRALKKGLSLEDIAEITGLSLETVEELSKQTA